MEHTCFFVSSRGLLRSCDIHNKLPHNSSSILDSNYKHIKKNDIVYVCNAALRNFFDNIFPDVKEPFVLVSGDCDIDPYLVHVEDTRILHWFCQNLLITHPKMTHMPIGLDYHTMKPNEIHPWGTGCLPIDQEKLLLEYKIQAKPIEKRYFGCYANFHHANWGIGDRGDRKEVVATVPKKLVYYEPQFTTRDLAWKHESQFIFVLSPRGNGVDCYRTWEALILGCIPVVKSSGLDPVYDDLPVCIVKEWSDLNEKFLEDYIRSIQHKRFNYDKLTLKYWVDLFKSKKSK